MMVNETIQLNIKQIVVPSPVILRIAFKRGIRNNRLAEWISEPEIADRAP